MAPQSPKKASSSQKPSDVVFVYSRSDDGDGYQVLRQRGDEIEAGTMRPLNHGKAIHGEVVSLQPREESPLLFDVEVEHDPAPQGSPGRPPKVATDKYRKGWESIWSRKDGSRALN